MNSIISYSATTKLLQGSETCTHKCVIFVEIIEIEIYFKFVKNQLNLYNCKHFPLHMYTLYAYIAYVYVCFQMHIHYLVYFPNLN